MPTDRGMGEARRARADGEPFPPAHIGGQQAYLMSPGGAYGPQFLVTENFKVIRAYNTSDLYALFVGHLADRIAGGGDFRKGWTGVRQLPTRGIEEIQQRLQGARLFHRQDRRQDRLQHALADRALSAQGVAGRRLLADRGPAAQPDNGIAVS